MSNKCFSKPELQYQCSSSRVPIDNETSMVECLVSVTSHLASTIHLLPPDDVIAVAENMRRRREALRFSLQQFGCALKEKHYLPFGKSKPWVIDHQCFV